MSVRFNAATEFVNNGNISGINLGDALTFMAWIYLVSNQNVPSGLFSLRTDSFTGWIVRTNADGVTLECFDANSSLVTAGSTLSVGTWYHVAFTKPSGSPGDATVYLNGVSDITRALTGSGAVAYTAMDCGDASYGPDIDFFDGRVAHARMWTAELNSTEIAAEMNSATPVRTSGLWVSSTFASDLDDQSGNTRHWTANGTLSFEADPPQSGTPSLSSWHPQMMPPRRPRTAVVASGTIGIKASLIELLLSAPPFFTVMDAKRTN